MSRAYLYVLRVSGPEDLIKVGLTRDPLARWSSFHPRWFENFNLDHSHLVETETRQDAQRLETQMHRVLKVHSCPMPITFSRNSGGRTEWYRGAAHAASAAIKNLDAEGYTTHSTARPLIATQMTGVKEHLYGWVMDAYARHCEGTLDVQTHAAISNLVDAHRNFGADIEEMFPFEIRRALGI